MDDVRGELIRSLSAAPRSSLVALDFDGTLAPIVADPETSRLAPGAADALTVLARAGVRIAMISGRDAATAVRLSGLADLPGLLVEGLYGAERWSHGTLTSPPEPAIMRAARTELPGVVDRASAIIGAAAAGVWIEDKRLSLVVHTRRAVDPAMALTGLEGPLAGLADRLGVELHPGRDVIELRLPGFDKGRALRGLLDELDPRAVMFAGDDLGDLPAFRYLAGLRQDGRDAWSVGVVRATGATGAVGAERPQIAAATDLQVGAPTDVVELLTEIGAALIPPREPGPPGP